MFFLLFLFPISTDEALAPRTSGNYNTGWFAIMDVVWNGSLIEVR